MKHFKYFLFALFLLLFNGIPVQAETVSIPKVNIIGDISAMLSKKDIRKVEIEYQDDQQQFKVYAEIKVQGTGSLAYEKKNYTINLYQDDTYKKKKAVDVGFGKADVYCLKANWIDKTHARNIVTARIAADIQKKYHVLEDTPHYGTIDGFPVEIYNNDEFLGLYTWNIPKAPWLFNMDEDNQNHLAFVGDTWDKDVLFYETTKLENEHWELEVGELNQSAIQKLNKLLQFVKDSSDQEFQANIQNYVDFDSLLNYYVLCEYAYLYDNIGKNLLLGTYDGKKWFLSLYDLDSSFGLHFYGTSLMLPYTDLIIEYPNVNYLFKRLVKNFPNEVANRYFQLRKTILTKDEVMKKFYAFADTIPSTSFELENQRWENIPGYDYTQIEEFLDVRTPVLDQYMHDLYTGDLVVSIQYQKNTDGSMTAKLVSNREDIQVLNNQGKKEYRFEKTGSFVFEYQDSTGKKGTIEAKVTWWRRISILPLLLGVVLVLGGVVMFYQAFLRDKKKKKAVVNKKKTTLNRRRSISNKRKR